MSTYTSEPGTRLAGRYLLVDQVAAGSGWTMWKAMDETLARPVSVLTFAPGFPRVSQVVTAARAASRLTDSRLAQVFDVEDSGDLAYVVLEWVGGESLTDLVADGPLDPAHACALAVEAARALAGAHAAGQAHLRLTPDSLRWTRSSGVKITGLGIDAALAGAGMTAAAASDPAVTDTRDLAALLYAALTGYWPGESQTRLPPAPVSDGMVCTPRQVTANVPPGVDGVVSRALLQRPGRQGPPIVAPAMFADALTSVAPPVPLPEPAPSMPRSGYNRRYDGQDRDRYGGYPDGPHPDDPGTWALPDRDSGAPGTRGGSGYERRYPAPERRTASRAVISVLIVLVLAAVAATAWLVSSGLHKSGGNQAGGKPKTSSSSTPHSGSVVLHPVGATSFNILGSDSENASTAGNAIDSSTTTFWSTDTYYNHPQFGNIKSGTGLIIDMGQRVRLSQVEVQFGTVCCTTAEIYLGNSNVKSKTALSNFTLVASAATASGIHEFTSDSTATGRYVLIWLTGNLPLLPGKVPAGEQAQYEAQIYNVVIRGTAVSSGTS
jgi:lipopolysaccharide export system protein LptC